MKKIILLAGIIVLIAQVASANYFHFPSTILHRDAVTSADGDASTIVSGSGLDGSKCEKFLLDIGVCGLTNANSWVVTPLYYSSSLSQYASGSSITVTSTGSYVTTTYGISDIYFRVSQPSGTGATIIIYATPLEKQEKQYK